MRRVTNVLATIAAAVCGCVGEQGSRLSAPTRALGDTLLTLFDSLETIHQATPDLALLSRMHPAADTLMFVEGPSVHRFTGDSLVRRVAAAHVGVHSMGPDIAERSILFLDADHALLTGREQVSWSDDKGVHQWEGLLTIVVARWRDRWVIRGYRM